MTIQLAPPPYPKEVGIMFKPELIRAIREDRKDVTRRLVNGEVNDDPDMWRCYGVEKNPELCIGKPPYDSDKTKIFDGTYAEFEFTGLGEHYANIWSRWEVGNLLYARETHAKPVLFDGAEPDYLYRADGEHQRHFGGKWKPAIHMRKEAARLYMMCTHLGCERINQISAADAINEGIEFEYFRVLNQGTGGYLFKNYENDELHFEDPIKSFRSLWNKIHGVPEPVIAKGETKPYKYIVYPFDIEAAAPYLGKDTWRGVPLHIVVNPWVWVIIFKTISKTGRPTLAELEKADVNKLWK